MKIMITGSSGLIGSKLIPLLSSEGHKITRLTRSRSNLHPDTVYWNPDKGEIETHGLEGHDAVVHLAGESIAGRWTREKKARIVESRVKSTKLLSETIVGLKSKPRVIVSASGIGYYGDRGDEILTEESEPGEGFLAELSVEWEKALRPAMEAGVRVVYMRLGIVLSGEGGALEKMLTPFKLGLGGTLGDGRQYWSWIAIDDVVRAIYYSLDEESLSGPVNFTAPAPVPNKEFTKALGEVLSRPALLTVPVFVLRGLFGDMADETMLGSTRAVPRMLLSSGYEFYFPELKGALEHVLL
ncbi:MAG: TIGR01777 family oxidoreductase [Thermodesulfobacteriota bacterium]